MWSPNADPSSAEEMETFPDKTFNQSAAGSRNCTTSGCINREILQGQIQKFHTGFNVFVRATLRTEASQ